MNYPKYYDMQETRVIEVPWSPEGGENRLHRVKVCYSVECVLEGRIYAFNNATIETINELPEQCFGESFLEATLETMERDGFIEEMVADISAEYIAYLQDREED